MLHQGIEKLNNSQKPFILIEVPTMPGDRQERQKDPLFRPPQPKGGGTPFGSGSVSEVREHHKGPRTLPAAPSSLLKA